MDNKTQKEKWSNVIKYANFVLILGFIFLCLDYRYFGQIDNQDFFTQFHDPMTWIYIAYIIIAEYLMFKILNGTRTKSTLILTGILFLPFLFFFWEFLQLAYYCTVYFCGDVFPPTPFTYLYGGLISIGTIMNLSYLFHVLRQQVKN